MLTRLNPLIQRFMSYALILNGTFLAINWNKNANPNKDDFILWVAIANIVVGLAVFVFGIWQKRQAKRDEG